MLQITNWPFHGYAQSWCLQQLPAPRLPSASGPLPAFALCLELWDPYTATCVTAQLLVLLHFQHLFITYGLPPSLTPIPPELPVTSEGSYEVSAASISLPNYVRGIVLLGFTLLTQWRDASASKRGLSFHSDSVSDGKGKGERWRWKEGEMLKELSLKGCRRLIMAGNQGLQRG